MLSRVAESIYWMGRYIERAENVARFISVNLNLSLDMPGRAQEQWWPLIVTSGDDQQFLQGKSEYSRESVIDFLTFDEDNPNSIVSCLKMARHNARSVREIISGEMWEHLNKFYLMVEDSGGLASVLDSPHEFFHQVNLLGQQFLGVADATMTHGEAWHFLQLGTMIERADKTSRIVDVKYFILLPDPEDVGTVYDDVQWFSLLRSASALEMYRQRHGGINPSNVVRFLVLDREFPRAILHCLTRGDESLHAISNTPSGDFHNLAEQRMGQLRSQLAYVRGDEIVAGGLHEFIDRLQKQLNLVGDAVHATFFAKQPMANYKVQSISVQ
jgi:uncharacterized alpha-E superfamily protein